MEALSKGRGVFGRPDHHHRAGTWKPARLPAHRESTCLLCCEIIMPMKEHLSSSLTRVNAVVCETVSVFFLRQFFFRERVYSVITGVIRERGAFFFVI